MRMADQEGRRASAEIQDLPNGDVGDRRPVLVIPRAAVTRLSIIDGFISDPNIVRELSGVVRTQSSFLPRSIAEQEPIYVQPIPIAYIRHRDLLLASPGDDRVPSDSLTAR